MKHTLIAIVVTGICFLTACSKKTNDIVNTPVLGTFSNMDSLFTVVANQPLYVKVVAGENNSFYGNSGTRYVFPANCFVDGSGTIVTGNVEIAVTEYLRKGDMIFSKLLPVNNDTNAIISAGEIRVSATQNNAPVYLAPGTFFQANVPQGGKPLAGINFFGPQMPADTSETLVNWVNTTVARGNTSYNGDSIVINSDSLGLGSAGVVLDSTTFKPFTVTFGMANAFLKSDVQASYCYVTYDNYKGIRTLGAADGNLVFTETRVPAMPVHIVIFAIIHHAFYGGVLAVTPVSGKEYTVIVTPVDPLAFKGQVNVLVD